MTTAADRLVVFDDERARRFEPFALTRPIGSLRVGALRTTERWERVARIEPSMHVAARHLEEYEEPGSRRIDAAKTLPAGTLVVNSRSIPSLDARLQNGDAVAIGERLAAVRLRSETAAEELLSGDALDRLAKGAGRRETIGGWWLDEMWDVVRLLNEVLTSDIRALGVALELIEPPDGTHIVGERAGIYLERGAKIEPEVLFDTTAGPVLVRRHATIQAWTRLSGPAFIGEHSTVAGDRLGSVSIGEWCKARGEMSGTTMLAYSNKGHDGFIGHSYLGSWVNIGAGTITSNLKNTYGSVALWTPDGIRDTGLQFLGTMFGDHVKTGIGLRLTTGCVLGAGANVFDRMPPKVVAPFAWGGGEPYDVFDADRFMAVAERMMSRRHVSLGEGGRRWLRAAHDARWSPGR